MSLRKIFKLFKDAAGLSPLMEGRMQVLPRAMQDINSEYFGHVLKDLVTGKQHGKKWPSVLVQPPNGGFQIVSNRGDINTHRFWIGFFTTSFYNGDGSAKNLNKNTNTSQKEIWEDWADMEEECRAFMMAVKLAIDAQGDKRQLQIVSPGDKLEYYTLSVMGDDRISGIFVQLWLNDANECNTNVINAFNAKPIAVGQ